MPRTAEAVESMPLAQPGSGTWGTVRRGLELSPELGAGIVVTLLLAAGTTAGRIIVPIAVQQTIDHGILATGGPDVARVWLGVGAACLAVLATGLCAYAVNVRLFRASESGLAHLRITAFRHLHDLSTLTQNAQRRGSLVSRVTSDVDTISTFVQSGGILLMVSLGQITLATILMGVYSPVLMGVVWVCFVPLLLLVRRFQTSLARAYAAVRERVGDLLAAVSEAVVGAATIRAYAVEDRTSERIDAAVERHRRAAIRAHIRSSLAFSSGQLIAGLTLAVVLVVGTVRAASGALTLGELLAFLFLVNLFTQPVQQATEILNELQNAVAGWRRVIAVVDTPADVADPGDQGVELPRGPIQVDLRDITFAYPGGATALRDVDLHIPPRSRVAVVGETGSGKSTLAKVLTRLVDPDAGRVLVDGVDLRTVRFRSLRERIVLVPQEGFLFDTSLLENIRMGRPDATAEDIACALDELGLADWLAGMPLGLLTPVGQRGEALSAGERQLVALARAYLAGPDLLVLDEATSAVDPATEVRIQRALEGLTRGRTSVTIAHRLATAERADEIVVVDDGQIVEHGAHADLVAAGGRYAALHASWTAQHATE